MKKVIVIMLALIALVLAGFAGFAYASAEHQALKGQKLLGIGGQGTGENPMGLETIYNTVFHITNPDCKKTITIDRVCIIKKDGSVIYDSLAEPLPWPETMEPHRIYGLPLGGYIPEETDLASYTVEITWSGKGLSLAGWSTHYRAVNLEHEKEVVEMMWSRSQMLNLRQK